MNERERFEAWASAQGHDMETEDGRFVSWEAQTAWEIWQAAATRWIPCSERMPTKKDGDAHGYVAWFTPGIGSITNPWNCGADKNDHWMSLPPDPTTDRQ